MKAHLEQILHPIWNILVNGYVLYEKTVIAEDLLGDAAQDSDGEVVSFESMTTLVLTFVETIADSKPYRYSNSHLF